MRWNSPSRKPKIDEWQPRFAWFPIRTIEGKWVWLERVERIHFLSRKISVDDYRNTSGLNYAYRTREAD